MQPSGRRECLLGVEDFADDGGEVNGFFVVEASLAAGEGEQRFDQAFLFSPRVQEVPADGPQRVEGDVGIGKRDLKHGSVDGEGGAQLMGCVGDEVTLGVECPFQSCQERVDGVAQFGEFVPGTG